MYLTLKLMQYHNAVIMVVGAETEIQPLQLTAAQMQWSMDEALLSTPLNSTLSLYYDCYTTCFISHW